MLLKTPRNDIWLLSLICFFFSQVDLPGAVLRNMSAMLDLIASRDALDACFATIADKTPRYKKYLERVCDDIRNLKVSKKEPVVFVCGVKDEMFKISFQLKFFYEYTPLCQSCTFVPLVRLAQNGSRNPCVGIQWHKPCNLCYGSHYYRMLNVSNDAYVRGY